MSIISWILLGLAAAFSGSMIGLVLVRRVVGPARFERYLHGFMRSDP